MKYAYMMIGNLCCCIALALAGLGCVGSKVHFDDIPLSKADMTHGRLVEGSCSGFQLLSLIPIGINDRQADAYSRLKQSAGRDYVTDIKITESWTWAYIGTVHKTRFNAMAYPEKSATGTGVPATVVGVPAAVIEAPSLEEKLSELKALHESHMLSDTEYESARARAIEQFK